MKKILFLAFVNLFLFQDIYGELHNWNSPSEVVKKVKENFLDLKTYKANFIITTTTNNTNSKRLDGVCYYKKKGKIRYNFAEPNGDIIVSDGKILWIFIKKLNVVGKQDLNVSSNKSDSFFFSSGTEEGLTRLFRKYHYKFNSIEQPQISPIDQKKYFILDLEQREKIGGFENMTLFVDAKTYFIRKAIAKDSYGKETTIEFSNIDTNVEIQEGIFNYRVTGTTKIVNNPLVTDGQ